MKKLSVAITVLFLAVLFFSGVSQALTLGENITIFDKMGTQTGTSPSEDNEVEPGMATGQKWDLEGFFYNRTEKDLTIIGGYDFLNGTTTTQMGDIFIDVDGNAQYGNPASSPSGLFGYDYVLDIDITSSTAGTYDIVKLGSGSTLSPYVTVTPNNWGSNPWKYASGGTILDTFSFDYYGNTQEIRDAATAAGLTGWGGFYQGSTWIPYNDNHYALTFNVADIAGKVLNTLADGASQKVIFHNTMQCGNDNLMGGVRLTKKGGPPVPEPSTIFLMFAGLLGLLGVRRMKG